MFGDNCKEHDIEADNCIECERDTINLLEREIKCLNMQKEDILDQLQNAICLGDVSKLLRQFGRGGAK